MKLIDFYKAFDKEVENKKKTLLGVWDNSTLFTENIFNEVIYKVLELEVNGYKKKGYEPEEERKKPNRYYQPEYYKIDCSGWSRIALESKVDKENLVFNQYCWGLDFAIEHENDYTDWMDEVIKLLYVNCPLRIVIGYNDRGLEGSDHVQLELVEESIQKIMDEFGRNLIVEGDEFGIVLGAGNTKSKTKDLPGYRYYQLQVMQDRKVKIVPVFINE